MGIPLAEGIQIPRNGIEHARLAAAVLPSEMRCLIVSSSASRGDIDVSEVACLFKADVADERSFHGGGPRIRLLGSFRRAGR